MRNGALFSCNCVGQFVAAAVFISRKITFLWTAHFRGAAPAPRCSLAPSLPFQIAAALYTSRVTTTLLQTRTVGKCMAWLCCLLVESLLSNGAVDAVAIVAVFVYRYRVCGLRH